MTPVNEFMQQFEHPLKPEIESVRQLILGAHPSIAEGIKWKAPSFRTDEYFATVNVRCQDAVQIILHLGAKVRPDIRERITVADSTSLLEWLGDDRASAKFNDRFEIEAQRPAFEAIVRQWITHLKPGKAKP